MISLHGGPKDHGFGLPPLANPGAAFVVGFKASLNLGYCVTKGHRAIRLIAAIADQGARPALWRADGLRRLFEV